MCNRLVDEQNAEAVEILMAAKARIQENAASADKEPKAMQPGQFDAILEESGRVDIGEVNKRLEAQVGSTRPAVDADLITLRDHRRLAYDDSDVGKRVRVRWGHSGDFNGTIIEYTPAREHRQATHAIRYDDGDERDYTKDIISQRIAEGTFRVLDGALRRDLDGAGWRAEMEHRQQQTAADKRREELPEALKKVEALEKSSPRSPLSRESRRQQNRLPRKGQ